MSVTVGERELTGAVGRVREAWRARCEKKKKQRGNKPGGRGVSCRQVRCRALPGKGVDRGKELWYSNPCNKNIAEWSSPVARRAHNPKVVGSNPASATTKSTDSAESVLFLYCRGTPHGNCLDGHPNSFSCCYAIQKSRRRLFPCLEQGGMILIALLRNTTRQQKSRILFGTTNHQIVQPDG